MSSSTPMNLEKLSEIWNLNNLFPFAISIELDVDLPWYWCRSNRSSQAPMSRCVCCGVTMICVILFLFNAAKRKLHAIPGVWARNMRRELAEFYYCPATMVICTWGIGKCQGATHSILIPFYFFNEFVVVRMTQWQRVRLKQYSSARFA